jgi:hypothetical protein
VRGRGCRLVVAVMREPLEAWMTTKTSTLTTGIMLITMGAGFLGAFGALVSLGARVRKLEKKGDSDAGE